MESHESIMVVLQHRLRLYLDVLPDEKKAAFERKLWSAHGGYQDKRMER